MKKVLFSLVAMMFAGNMVAQTPEEKAAAKAAAAAEKQANKDAQKLLDAGLKFYDNAKAKFDEINSPNFEQYEKDPAKKQAKKDAGQVEILKFCAEGEPIVGQALATGRISEKKLFDAWYKRDFMISQLLNAELQKAGANIPFDTTKVCEYAVAISDACHNELKYGDPKDDTQKTIMSQVKKKFPGIHMYHAYATLFQTQRGDLKGACKAFDEYQNFATKYPEIADNERIKNPEYPFSQFAFNIYYTAYNQKDYDTMSKYYDMALQYDDTESQDFVKQSGVQVYLQKGDTIGWVNACKNMIKQNPSSEMAETYVQNLLAHYSKQGSEQMGAFADEILAIVPESKIANYGKGFALFSKQNYTEALKYYEKTVAIDPDYMEGNYQCGSCLYNIGKNNYNTIRDKKYSTQAAADKEAETKVKSYFRKAAPYFEKVRELVPDEPARWAGELKVIYGNLGMKKEAAEIPSEF